MRPLSGSSACARCPTPKTKKQMVIHSLGNGGISQIKDEPELSISGK